MARVIGLMSGTSVDGIDAALVDIEGRQTDLTVTLIAAETYDYPDRLRQKILSVCAGEALSMAQLADLDDEIARCFAEAALAIQEESGQSQPGQSQPGQSQPGQSQPGQSTATLIGSHGQTVFHRPPTQSIAGDLGYSLQLGRGATIAKLTGLTTIANFRAADIAAGGQGAPLVPLVDAYLLGDEGRSTVVQNIGGIGNLTYIPPRSPSPEAPDWLGQVRGWDTGPGNSLIDIAVQRRSAGKLAYDADGAWAARGTPDRDLVDLWLRHPYFQQSPPKSTGRELFGWAAYPQYEQEAQHLSDADFIASLTEFTAASIALNCLQFLPQLPDRLLLCGGGARNGTLWQRLALRLPQTTIQSTTDLGLDADAKEAIAFAVLAHWRSLDLPGNLPAVTGARSAVGLGEVYHALPGL
jgi:anhydro-N-acetylmuramic acid kinase